jgi:hypothetical protein
MQLKAYSKLAYSKLAKNIMIWICMEGYGWLDISIIVVYIAGPDQDVAVLVNFIQNIQQVARKFILV